MGQLFQLKDTLKLYDWAKHGAISNILTLTAKIPINTFVYRYNDNIFKTVKN